MKRVDEVRLVESAALEVTLMCSLGIELTSWLAVVSFQQSALLRGIGLTTIASGLVTERKDPKSTLGLCSLQLLFDLFLNLSFDLLFVILLFDLWSLEIIDRRFFCGVVVGRLSIDAEVE